MEVTSSTPMTSPSPTKPVRQRTRITEPKRFQSENNGTIVLFKTNFTIFMGNFIESCTFFLYLVYATRFFQVLYIEILLPHFLDMPLPLPWKTELLCKFSSYITVAFIYDLLVAQNFAVEFASLFLTQGTKSALIHRSSIKAGAAGSLLGAVLAGFLLKIFTYIGFNYVLPLIDQIQSSLILYIQITFGDTDETGQQIISTTDIFCHDFLVSNGNIQTYKNNISKTCTYLPILFLFLLVRRMVESPPVVTAKHFSDVVLNEKAASNSDIQIISKSDDVKKIAKTMNIDKTILSAIFSIFANIFIYSYTTGIVLYTAIINRFNKPNKTKKEKSAHLNPISGQFNRLNLRMVKYNMQITTGKITFIFKRLYNDVAVKIAQVCKGFVPEEMRINFIRNSVDLIPESDAEYIRLFAVVSGFFDILGFEFLFAFLYYLLFYFINILTAEQREKGEYKNAIQNFLNTANYVTTALLLSVGETFCGSYGGPTLTVGYSIMYAAFINEPFLATATIVSNAAAAFLVLAWASCCFPAPKPKTQPAFNKQTSQLGSVLSKVSNVIGDKYYS